MSDQTIDLRTGSAAVEYTNPVTITETTGKDISGAGIELSLGSASKPGTWRAPDADLGAGPSRTVQLLIGDSYKPPGGAYHLWSRITDAPEVVPRKHQRVFVLADPT